MESVKNTSKIVIYGLGRTREMVEERLDANDSTIVAYVDGISEIESFNNKPFYKREEINCITFDYIIIAIEDTKIKNEAKQYLIRKQNISGRKIIDYDYYMKNSIKLVRVMESSEQPYNGMILGMSYAEVGIIPELLRERFCNLAVSSQDIFYNYKTMEFVYRNYEDKLDLKYLIIDMYDYRWFNYDLSQGKMIYQYICEWNGFPYDMHNIDLNCNLTQEQKAEIKEQKNNIIDKEIYKLFDKDYRGSMVAELRMKVVQDECVKEKINSHFFRESKHENTLKENVEYFEKTLHFVKKVNPNIRIICMLIPRFNEFEKIIEPFQVESKKYFTDLIEKWIEQYDVEFYNFRDLEMASQRGYFFDFEHLNYEGAKVFTEYIEKILF